VQNKLLEQELICASPVLLIYDQSLTGDSGCDIIHRDVWWTAEIALSRYGTYKKYLRQPRNRFAKTSSPKPVSFQACRRRCKRSL
jgi:hypothetical protein